MQTGKLDQKITLENPVETNTGGELLVSYVAVETVFGHVRSQRGNESFEAARQESKATLRILLRFRDDIKTDWRIKWDDQYYNIIYIDRADRRKGELWLTVEGVSIS